MANHQVILNKQLIYDNITKTDSGCWEWQGYILAIGYGQICSNFKRYQAHRVSKHLWDNFDLSSPLLICHHCDNRKCVNPKHLFVGTYKDNAQDMVRKGRHNTAKKLTPNEVFEIRYLHAQGLTYEDLSEIYPVTKFNIASICQRKTWRHL